MIRTGRRAGTAAAVGLSVALAVAAVVLAVRDGLTWRAFATGDLGLGVLLAVTFPLLGATVLHREPGNRLGPCSCWSA